MSSFRSVGFLLAAFIALVSGPIFAQERNGERLPVSASVRETNSDVMQRQALAPPRAPRPEHELEYPDRDGLPQNPDAAAVPSTPIAVKLGPIASTTLNIHTTSFSFDGATLADTGAFPPDSMGTVGPTQFIVFVNGRIRSFNKSGIADGVIDADPDVFFAPASTPVSPPVVLDFTSDPQIRYDRFTARWFMSIIDVPCTNATCTTTAANRWMVAVSDAASNGTISGSTVWTLFEFQADPGTSFCDYPSLGIDVNALYMGCSIFSNAGTFVGTNGYVIQKTSVLGAGPMVVTMFANLAVGTGAGPESPRGVDNFDAAATEGYFIGPDNATFSTIMFRRVSNPGSLTPTISANIAVTVPTTTIPNPVDHAGNTGGNNGRLDSLDDRIFQAMIRNGRLWTAHNFRVSSAGVANTAAQARNASRWYEFQNLTTTPTLVQSGTVFDNAATRAAALQYWIPTVTVTGQGHSVLAFSAAGTPLGATPAYVGRLAGSTLGTMVGPPTGGAVQFGVTSHNYNPASDPGGTSGRRWGDYSFTVVDPLDDMSVWTIQEYNQAANSYAVRVGHLLAPPPATPTCSATPISFPGSTGNVVIVATSSAGSGFYDPGTDLPAPALPFTHLGATVTNAIVNSATYNSPTQVTLNITANTAGLQSVTIVNPDGQSVTATGCINVTSAPATKLKFTTQPANGTAGQTLATVAVSVEDSVGNIITSDNSTQVTLALSSSTLNGTATQTAVNGVATFANLSINTAATGYTLTATSTPALTSDVSTTFNISPAAAASIAFGQQPGNTTAGVPINPAPTVQLFDAFGNLASNDNSSLVSISAASGPGSLAGGGAISVTGGVATFPNLILTTAGTYTLSANSGALSSPVSSSFVISAAAGAQLAFLQQPANSVAGIAISPAIAVQLQDQFGNALTTSGIAVTLTASGPGAITGGGSANTSNGVATFSATVIQAAGTYTLAASASGFTTANSNNFTIAPAAASKLAFAQQPTNTVAGQSIAPAITVSVQDAFNNVVTSSSASVALAIGANPGTSTLTGGGVTAAVAGVATFSGVSLNKSGTGYTLNATSAGLTSATSSTFNIVAGAASKLVYSTQPALNANVAAGAAINLIVQVQDALGNIVISDASTVTISIGSNPGSSSLAGTTSIAAVAGVATFTGQGLALNKVGTGYTLLASDSNIAVNSATSNAFNIVPGAASQLVFLQQPSDIVAGTIMAPSVTVRVLDASGNQLTSSVNVVSLSIATGPAATLFGGGALNDNAGLVTYNALSLQTAGTYTLSASSSGLTGATSGSFVVSPGPLHHLLVTTQPPANDIAGSSFATGAQLLDQFNNVLTNDSVSTLSVSLNPNPGNDPYAGNSAQVTAGVASFNITLTKAANAYRLLFVSGAKSVLSNGFNVVAAAGSVLAFVQQPADVLQGNSLAAVSVQSQDSFGNRDLSDSSTSVALSIVACGAPISLGTVTASNGLASFPNPGPGIHLYTIASGLHIQADGGSFATASSQGFSVTNNIDLVFTDGFDSCRL